MEWKQAMLDGWHCIETAHRITENKLRNFPVLEPESSVICPRFIFGSCRLSTGVTCVIRRLATQHQGQSEDSKSSSPSPIKLHLPHKQPLDLTKKSNVGLWVDPYRRGCGYAVAKMKRSVTVRSWWQTCSTELCQQMVRIAASLLIAKPPNLQNKFFSGFPAGSWDPFHF